MKIHEECSFTDAYLIYQLVADAVVDGEWKYVERLSYEPFTDEDRAKFRKEAAVLL